MKHVKNNKHIIFTISASGKLKHMDEKKTKVKRHSVCMCCNWND
jgi:hypothetical protein